MASTITDGIRPVSGVEFPERRKLKFFDKVPQLPAQLKPPKMMKDLYDMRGPELIHNKLQYGEFGIQVCITTTASLSLYHYHCIAITVSLSLSLYCYHCITIPASLSLLHYHCITIPASLSLHRYHCFTITVSLSLHHYHCVTIPASLPLYHYQPVICPPQQATVWGVWNSGLYLCHCITVSLSPTTTGCSMESLVFRSLSLSLHHYQSVSNSLSPTHHNRLYRMGSLVFRSVASLSLYISLSVCDLPTTTSYSMGSLVFRSVSLSLNHYH